MIDLGGFTPPFSFVYLGINQLKKYLSMSEEKKRFYIQSTYTILGFIKIIKTGRTTPFGNTNYGEYNLKLFGITFYKKREKAIE